MLRNRLSLLLGVGVAFAVVGTAGAQYSTGFEAADGITASPSGTVLTGQDGYYIPTGTTSVDALAYTYSGNALGMPANPTGGDQFVGGTGPGDGTTYIRAQRDVAWGTGVWAIGYDQCCAFSGNLPGANNVGSVSTQPYPGSASSIDLTVWSDLNACNAWDCDYVYYNAAGATTYASSGDASFQAIAGFHDLPNNQWYRRTTTFDFASNRIITVAITDLSTNQTTSYNPTDWYMQGGSAGGQPIPSGFRLFVGGGAPGNSMGYDNIDIAQAGPPPYTLTVSGSCPGTVTLNWSGAEPNKQQAIVFGNNMGSTMIPPNHPCAGTTLGVAGGVMQVGNYVGTGANGSGQLNGNAVNAACNHFLQLVTGGSCATSSVAQIP